jgi:ribosome biogenesis GTPase
LRRRNASVIDQVLTRKSAVIRKQPGKELREQVLAANIGVLFIVSGIDRDYNPRRIERYLVLAENSGARPVIVLNKVDLVSELGLSVKEITSETQCLSPMSPVLLVSAASGQGLERFAGLFTEGETGALVGSSGVGKSTIINRTDGRATAEHLRSACG